MAKVVEVPRGYYARTHEERYRAIIGSGAAFRERDMSQYVQPAWREFVAAAGPEILHAVVCIRWVGASGHT